MEAGTNKFWLKFKNPMLALVFLGILMIVIGALLPSDTDENIRRLLIFLGLTFALMSFCIIAFPYIQKGMGKISR